LDSIPVLAGLGLKLESSGPGLDLSLPALRLEICRMCRFFKANFGRFSLTCLFTRCIDKVTVTHNWSSKLNSISIFLCWELESQVVTLSVLGNVCLNSDSDLDLGEPVLRLESGGQGLGLDSSPMAPGLTLDSAMAGLVASLVAFYLTNLVVRIFGLYMVRLIT
jgi:hypothetical protein